MEAIRPLSASVYHAAADHRLALTTITAARDDIPGGAARVEVSGATANRRGGPRGASKAPIFLESRARTGSI
jgi:hypothetical protein